MILESRDTLIEKLRKVPLRGSEIYPYKNAFITLGLFDPAFFSPCQRYVLSDVLRHMEHLQWDYLQEWRVDKDILALDGYLRAEKFDDFGAAQDILPIILEEVMMNGKIHQVICDGQHRAYLAYQRQRKVTAVYIRGACPSYYAYPLREGWDDVEIIDRLDANYIKKFHTCLEYKERFRDFTAVFNNGSVSRPRAVK
jgi:hypothetical protein